MVESLFSELFIFELANNHQGDIEHGKKIVSALQTIQKKHKIKAAVKFQLRDLDTFVHPKQRDSTTNKHIRRFLETELDPSQFQELSDWVRKSGMISMSTVFDEISVDVFLKLKFEILKIGSCSARDYRLLKRISQVKTPTILSTAGLSLDQIDQAVWVLNKGPQDLAIMHCVAIYPTDSHMLILDRIQAIQRRFPGYKIGFSTHEKPDSILPLQLASALGATLFEKHVGLPTKEVPLNSYSATPEQVDQWIGSYKEALALRDFEPSHSEAVLESERTQLRALERAVYAGENLAKGQSTLESKLLLAIPAQENQVMSSDLMSNSIVADQAYQAVEPLGRAALQMRQDHTLDELLRFYSHLVVISGIDVGSHMEAELSLHHGKEKASRSGALIITALNESLCKKWICLAPGQEHSSHFHSDREEFLRLVYGDSQVSVDEQWQDFKRDSFVRIKQGSPHSFKSKGGAILEELTTHYVRGKSVYKDPAITQLKIPLYWRKQRWNWNQ